MLHFVIFIALLYFCYKNKPSKESYIEFVYKDKAEKKGWFNKMASMVKNATKHRPDIKYSDYFFFATVYDMEARMQLIGILGYWFPLQQQQVSGSLGSNLTSVQVEDEAEVDRHREAAIQCKAKRDLDGAYHNYLKAAQLLENGDKYSQLEAGGIYEEASRCTSNTLNKTQAMNKAVKLYEVNDGIRAARLYEKIGDLYCSKMEDAFLKSLSQMERLKRASGCYLNCIDFYERSSDHRFVNVLTKAADCLAGMKVYQKAFVIYEKFTLEKLNAPTYEYKNHLLSMALCKLVQLDWVSSDKWLNEYVLVQFPAIENEREFKFIKDVISAGLKNDIESFDSALKEFTSFQPLREEWKNEVIVKLRQSLESEGLT